MRAPGDAAPGRHWRYHSLSRMQELPASQTVPAKAASAAQAENLAHSPPLPPHWLHVESTVTARAPAAIASRKGGV